MRVMGIDPGMTLTGYGLVEEAKGVQRYIASGCIDTQKYKTDTERLNAIFDNINYFIEQYQPEALILEKIFFNKNVTTAIRIGEARGVIMLAASRHGIDVYEYTPLEIKQVVAGYGKASKQQVEKMVKLQLKLQNEFKYDDESDALAVCLCYLAQRNWQNTIEGR